jgi:hypothetical protein
MIGGRIVKSLVSGDGLYRALIVVRGDGFYQIHQEAHEPTSHSGWAPAGVSGIYGSLADVEHAAHHELPWLRNRISD